MLSPGIKVSPGGNSEGTWICKIFHERVYPVFLFKWQLKLGHDFQEHRLRLLGGTNVRTSVKYVVDCCMTSGLQHQFNWEGRLGWKTKTNQCKKGFKSTRLCDIMMSKCHIRYCFQYAMHWCPLTLQVNLITYIRVP